MRYELLAFFREQRQLILERLDETGALRLSLSGEVEPVILELYACLSLEQMQQAVDGYISIHTWDSEQHTAGLSGTCLVTDEDGKYTGKPINALATYLWYQVYPLGRYIAAGQGTPDFIVGEVLLTRAAVLRGEAA